MSNTYSSYFHLDWARGGIQPQPDCEGDYQPLYRLICGQVVCFPGCQGQLTGRNVSWAYELLASEIDEDPLMDTICFMKIGMYLKPGGNTSKYCAHI